jgi:hypothetical protein
MLRFASMNCSRFVLPCFLIACTAATWADTFSGTSARSAEDASAIQPSPEADLGDASISPQACTGLATSKAAPAITVTFPNHGTPGSETIHVVVGTQSCDLHVDSDTDGVIFASDATPCAALIAPGTPGQSSATVSGDTSPTALLFQWSYTDFCTIDDDYSLSKK